MVSEATTQLMGTLPVREREVEKRKKKMHILRKYAKGHQKPSATCHTTQGWELQATDIVPSIIELCEKGQFVQKIIFEFCM